MSVDNGSTYPFRNFREKDVSTTPDSAVDTGSGGGSLDVFDRPEDEQKNRLWTAPFLNQSQYDIVEGIFDTTTKPFRHMREGDTSTTPASAVDTGSGGGDMEVFLLPRDEFLASLTTAGFTNESSFGVPGTIFASAKRPFRHEAEANLGFAITGKAVGPGGGLLEGSISVTNANTGEEVSADSVSGNFTAGIEPPGAVVDGADGEGVQVPPFDISFQPKVDGIGVSVTNAEYPRGATIQATYGYIAGYITDVLGDPVADEVVAADTATTATDSEGFYSILAPGGNDVTLLSLGASESQSTTAVGGETTELNWSFPGIQIAVLGPEYRPVTNAPVVVDGTVYNTNSAGKVVVPALEIGDYEITIMGEITRSTSLSAEGQLKKIQFQGGSRIDIQTTDSESGEGVTDLIAVDEESGFVSYTDEGGVVSVVGVGDAALRVAVGKGSTRYEESVFEESLSEGETKKLEATLERKVMTTNY